MGSVLIVTFLFFAGFSFLFGVLEASTRKLMMISAAAWGTFAVLIYYVDAALRSYGIGG